MSDRTPEHPQPPRVDVRVSLVAGALLLASVVILTGYPDRLSDVVLISPEGAEQPVSVPFLNPHAPGGEYAFEGSLQGTSQRIFHVIPRGCVTAISVNGVGIPAEEILGDTCDSRRGFHVPLGPYLGDGDNEVAFRVGVGFTSAYEQLGLRVQGSFLDWVYALGFGLALLCAGVLYFQLLIRARFGSRTAAILVLSLCVQLGYLSHTDCMTRSHDASGHVAYVKHIGHERALPDAGDCAQCYHPPLYYLTAVGPYMGAAAWLPGAGGSVLQLVSVLLFNLFILSCVRIVQRCVGSSELQIGFVALVALWPSSFLHAVRVGNDLLLYPLFALALLSMLKWQQEDRSRPLFLAAALTGLAMLTKSNAVVLVALLLVLLGTTFVSSAWRGGSVRAAIGEHLPRTAVVLAILLLASGIALHGPLSSKLRGESEDVLVGNVDALPEGLRVENGPLNYLVFDLADYVRSPYANAWRDEGGRQYFWNYLVKTALFGEWDLGVGTRRIATLLSLLFLVLLPFGIWGAVITARDVGKDRSAAFLLAATVLMLASLAANRYLHPFACSGDFRYILPVLPCGAVFLGKAHASMRARDGRVAQILRWILTMALISFVVLSVVRMGVVFSRMTAPF